jgi:hypothetical protein
VVSLTEENFLLKREIDQLKNLNKKLVERVELLQSVIDKEASANTFYYNYPPKPEDQKQVKK